jgi:hypothetical protein
MGDMLHQVPAMIELMKTHQERFQDRGYENSPKDDHMYSSMKPRIAPIPVRAPPHGTRPMPPQTLLDPASGVASNNRA